MIRTSLSLSFLFSWFFLFLSTHGYRHTNTRTVQTHHFQTFAKSLSFQRFQLGKSFHPITFIIPHHDEMGLAPLLAPCWCPWFLWSNHPNYTPPLHILLVDDKWVQYTWGLARTVSFYSANRFKNTPRRPLPKKIEANHLLKNFQIFFSSISWLWLLVGELGGMICFCLDP